MSDSPDTVVRGARVIDLETRSAPRADLLLADGRIAEIGPPGLQAPAAARVIDATDRLAIPGLVNAHTHGHGALGKGAGDRWTLELLLNSARCLTVHETPEEKYLSTLVGALEMLRKGATACYDLFFELPLPTPEGLEAVGRAYRDAGVRAVVAPMMADLTFYEAIPGLIEAIPEDLRGSVRAARARPAEAHLAACREAIARWPFDRDRVRLALAPTIPLHCTDGFLTGCRDLADEHGLGLHMHLAESKVQAVAGIERYGRTLTAHLDRLGFLGPRFTAAHAIWLDADDIARLADRGAGVAHNPGSNLRLGSGVAPAREMRRRGLEVGIGTDGASCSDHQNMFEAMRLAAYVSRVRGHDPEAWLGAADVLRMATEGGARVLGLEGAGRIEPGAPADLTFIDLGHINWLPMNDPVSQVVNTEDGSAVDGVMVGGEVLLWEGRFTRVDLAAMRRDVERTVERLRARAAPNAPLARALERHVRRHCVGLAGRDYHVRATVPDPAR